MATADLIKDKSKEEKAQIKAKEIAKVKSLPKTKVKKYDIEVVDIEEISGGIQVLARAWEQGKQIGFGKDGSVDIERFVIVNPPILVEDPLGDIVIENTDIRGRTSVAKFREDPREALLQSLEHIIDVKQQKFGEGNIVQGKIGNTTTTVYPSLDGRVSRESAGTWAATRGGNGTNANDTNTTQSMPYMFGSNGGSDWLFYGPAHYLFDTSSIPDTDNIDSATFSVYVNSKETTTFSVGMTLVNPASDSALAASDYQIAIPLTTRQATDIAQGSITTGAYNTWTLNATGLSNINKTGLTKLSQRIDYDIDNSEPSGSSVWRGIDVRTADFTGTSSDPTLVVEHTAVAVADSPLSNLSLLGVG